MDRIHSEPLLSSTPEVDTLMKNHQKKTGPAGPALLDKKLGQGSVMRKIMAQISSNTDI
jgi:hypothetical protein